MGLVCKTGPEADGTCFFFDFGSLRCGHGEYIAYMLSFLVSARHLVYLMEALERKICLHKVSNALAESIWPSINVHGEGEGKNGKQTR